jgi:hypothetical protein
MRLLVCGGRNFSDVKLAHEKITKAIGTIFMTPPTIIHGGAKGADEIAGEYASINGFPCEVYPADWSKHGRAAGPIRNRQMIVEGRPNAVLCLPGGRGTQNMAKQAAEAGIMVYMVAPKEAKE